MRLFLSSSKRKEALFPNKQAVNEGASSVVIIEAAFASIVVVSQVLALTAP